ncbi:nuclear transport factor 2 family protein [Paraglaciecola sp.]|uniref:nuclear transport factor 2 family protein n=1 Tax=Paraglaciecola sp. TaxID=1920173 RepID=UPI003264442E
MTDPTVTFFDAWQCTEPEQRLEKIDQSVTDKIKYDDPRTPQTINGKTALNEYVGMFSANAPGWSAKVVGCDTIAGMTRATVAFGGKGPDGKDMIQHGQYFIETEDELISRMVGFAGTGLNLEK